MYDFYPEWGPARHRENGRAGEPQPTRRPRYWQPSVHPVAVLSGAPEARDVDGDRPDDN